MHQESAATPNHRRYFFTIYTAERRPALCRTHEISVLRGAFQETLRRHPFDLDAICVLPDHMHCIWTLPEGDDDHAARWLVLQSTFNRLHKSQRSLWDENYECQPLTSQTEFSEHMDEIHFDAVKHGHVSRPLDWPWSSFHVYVRRGMYEENWGQLVEVEMLAGACWGK